VPVFDVGRIGDLPYYAMELIEGEGLDQVLARRPRPDAAWFREAARIAAQAADALAYAHGEGVIHRDVKPSNLIRDSRGTLWVADFGLAWRSDDPSLTSAGSMIGTPRYMSPEQAGAVARPVDHRADVYGLGVTLYEMLARRPAHDGPTPADILTWACSTRTPDGSSRRKRSIAARSAGFRRGPRTPSPPSVPRARCSSSSVSNAATPMARLRSRASGLPPSRGRKRTPGPRRCPSRGVWSCAPPTPPRPAPTPGRRSSGSAPRSAPAPARSATSAASPSCGRSARAARDGASWRSWSADPRCGPIRWPIESPRMPTLAELAKLCGATLVGGDGQAVSRVAPLEEAGPGELSLLLDRKHVASARETRAIALLTTPALRDELARPELAYLLSPQPRLALVPVLRAFESVETPAPGIDPRAFVDPGARVDPSAVVGPFAYVGPRAHVGPRVVLHPFAHVGAASTIGEGTVLHPGATLYPRCRLGRNVVVHAGCVLGSDGFGYVPEGRRLLKVPQVGAVEVEDDAEVGANTTVDRATLGSTRIGRGTKVDNLVQLGHNVSLGEDNAISALTGISGSTSTGRNVTLAGQVGTQAHIHIGDGVVAAGQTGVTKDIPAGMAIAGYSVPHREWLRAESLYRRLPELKKELDALQARIAALEAAAAKRRATSAPARRPKSPRRRKRPSARGRRR